MSRKYKMSTIQKRLFLIDQMQGANITYNVPILLKAEGGIDLLRLNKAINHLCYRHELLRTRFVETDDKFLQIIEDTAEVSLEIIEGEENEVDEICRNFIKPFNLNEAPLMRALVIKTQQNRTILMFDIHHIIFDGGSLNVFFNDLSRLYNGEELPELKIQYKNYMYWHNSLDLREQEEYWTKEISDEIPILDLKTDYPRPQQKSFKGNGITKKADNSLKDAVRSISLQSRSTEYSVLLSVYILLLSKYSRQKEILIGTPVSGRNHTDAEDMLGMFVNTLVIKGELSDDMTFIDLVKSIKEKCLNAFENQEYPFESLVEKVNLRRDPSRNAMFDAMFVLQNNEKTELTLGNTKFELLEVENQVSKFDLTLSVEDTDNGYTLAWEYCTDLFKRVTIERIAEHFNILLENVLNNPHIKISEFEMLSKQEKEKLLYEYNATDAEFPADRTVIELFEEQVLNNPDLIAVEYESQVITYKELNVKSNYIGYILRRNGIKPDDIVSIVTDRSLEMIIAIYGILKAGGAYLPIDPTYPLDRVSYMLEDSRSKVLLAGPGSQEIVNGISDITIINMLDHKGEIEEDLPHVSKPNNLAYIIFTSGSTGNPKGVMIENRSLVNLSYWFMKRGEYNFDSVILQNFNYIFDGSVAEIFPCNLAGSKLHILSNSQRDNLESLINLMQQKQITIVPSMFRLLLEYAKNNPEKNDYFNELDRLFLAAEAVTSDMIQQFTELNGDLNKLCNNYGPTEGTVCSTCLQFNNDMNLNGITIGKPISNCKVYILNGPSLCGIGMPGELCIGGIGVARGYLNRPELTAEKFIVNPFIPGERIYRTGDLARWMDDGNIEYLGRIDEQVKIRGFRIELGEIENKLRQINSIQDAVVITKEKNQETYLCGYLISEEKIDVEVVRNSLENDLPEYMIPSYFKQLEKFPYTRTGKLDRNSLPEPEIKSIKEYVAPSNKYELIVSDVFKDILNVAQVGIYDSFFELGGNSLKVIKLINILEQKLGVRLQVTDIFTLKTIQKIARRANEAYVKNSYIEIAVAQELEE